MRNAIVAGLALVSAQYGILTWLMLDLRDHAHIPLTRGALFLAWRRRPAPSAASRSRPGATAPPALRFRLLTLS